MLIIGGDKLAAIESYEILVWYRGQFHEYLSKSNTRLMVIGYGFKDKHINEVLCSAAQRVNFSMFVIDSCGVDVIGAGDKTSSEGLCEESQLKGILNPTIVGASSRGLLDTFGNDELEFNKVMRFFEE